jgi:hypothetical protein
MSKDDNILEELENSDWSKRMSIFFEMIDEIEKFVPSNSDGTFLVCSYKVGAILQDSSNFTIMGLKYSSTNPYLCGKFKGINLYLDKYIKGDDYKLYLRKGSVNHRDIIIDNLLNDNTKVSEQSIDLSHYKNIID